MLESDGTHVGRSMPFLAEEQVQSHVEQSIVRLRVNVVALCLSVTPFMGVDAQ